MIDKNKSKNYLFFRKKKIPNVNDRIDELFDQYETELQ